MFDIQFGVLVDFEDEDVVDGILDIPEGVEELENFQRYKCRHEKIKKVVLPSTVRRIRKNAFSSYVFNNVETIKLNDGLKVIEDNAFEACFNLKSISIPNSVTSIGENAFRGCKNLTKVSLSQNIKELNNNLFFECVNLKNIEIPKSVEVVKNKAFYNCPISQIKLPSNLKYVEKNAFDKNTKIIIDKQALLKNKNILVWEKDSLNSLNIIENKNDYIVSYTKEEQNDNSLLANNYIFGDDKKLNELFNNRKNLNIDYKLIQALQNDIKQNNNIDMHFFNLLLKQFGNDISRIDILAYNLGLFKGEVKEKRISKNGNEIEENVNYSQKVYEFFRDKDISLFKNITGFDKCEFKPEFCKFILKDDNFNKMLDFQKNNPKFIANCYNYFEDVQATNKSNKGSQRQLKPTVEKFKSFFEQNKFKNITGYTELAFFLGKYTNDQETFDSAKQIIETQKKNNIESNITKKSVVEQKQEKIEQQKKSIIKNALQIIKNLAHISNKEFTYEFLDKHSYLNLVLGKLCSCCAHIEGAGSGVAVATMLSPDFQNLVIRDEDNNIVAKSTLYINRKQRYGVFNNVEINNLVPSYEYENIYKAFNNAVQQFVKTYNEENPTKKLKQINVGMGNNDLAVQFISHNKKGEVLYAPSFADYSTTNMYYRNDSWYKQYIVYKYCELPYNKDNEKEV